MSLVLSAQLTLRDSNCFFEMEGNAIKKPINLTTAPYKTLFMITREMTSELMSRVIKDPNRKPVKIWNLIQMAELYVVQSSDKARITRCGGLSLK